MSKILWSHKSFFRITLILEEVVRSDGLFFFGGGWDSNPRPYIYYALFISTKLSSRGREVAVYINKRVIIILLKVYSILI